MDTAPTTETVHDLDTLAGPALSRRDTRTMKNERSVLIFHGRVAR
jgi:hypothetical protein